ncbi:unnamed protein product [Caenorhabditis brenneri]
MEDEPPSDFFDELPGNATKAADALKDAADGSLFFVSKLSPQFAAIVAVGLGVKNLINFKSNGGTKPDIAELKELQARIETLDQKMANHVNSMQAFFVKFDFFKTYVTPTSSMMKTVRQSKSGSKILYDLFKSEYETKQPLILSNNILTTLEQETTNPVTKSMEADDLMSTAVFDQWKTLIDGLFVELIYIESYASGLFNDGNLEKKAWIDANYEKICKLFDKWKTNYERNALYWPDKIRQFVEKIQVGHKSKTSRQKAELIQKGLETVLTNEIFYIIVFRSEYGHGKYSSKEDQFFLSERGDSKVIIYRSKSATAENQKGIEEEVEKHRNMPAILESNFKRDEYLEEWVKSTPGLKNTGLATVIGGPGWWIDSTTLGGHHYFLLAACE